MRREIYENGILVEVVEDSSFISSPNWTSFNLKMLNDKEYNRVICQTKALMSARRLETLAITQTDNIEIFKLLWDDCMNKLDTKPSPDVIQSWNQTSESCFMPFYFDSNGILVIK